MELQELNEINSFVGFVFLRTLPETLVRSGIAFIPKNEVLPSFFTSMDSMPLLFTTLNPARTWLGSKPIANTRLQSLKLNPGAL